MNNGVEPHASEIRRWLAALDQQEQELQAQLEPLVRQQSAIRDRRRLLSDLLASYGEAAPNGESGTASLGPESVRQRVRRQVRLVLNDTGGGMHINDIHAEFVKRGFEVPGKGRPANITAHLSGGGDIVSPERGIYGLESVVGAVKTKPVRRKRSSKRRK